MLRWVLIVILYIIIDWYAYQAVRTIAKFQWINWLYWLISILVVGNLIYQIFINQDNLKVLTPTKSYALGFFITLLIPKLVLISILFVEDIIRVPQAIYSYFMEGGEETGYMPSRRTFISYIALGIAAVPFASFLYGIYKGKYNYKVLKYVLHFEDLPEAFDGYKITQISDIHSGSFDNIDKVAYGIDLINEQQGDVILFTGDMVNNLSVELSPYIELFSKLEAKDGMFSVLGNHDYGDYTSWDSEQAKQENLQDLIRWQKDIGFEVLLNESRYIEKDGQRLAIIGVENWGKGGFKKAGDLNKATQHIINDDFKILMSHDPSHWEFEVVPHAYHYHLTLSGHTHGMQFGIEIPGWIKWSPVKWRYKYWAGIYEQFGQYINVNRGFGYLAFPGRVGIWPEITVIELKKGLKSA